MICMQVPGSTAGRILSRPCSKGRWNYEYCVSGTEYAGSALEIRRSTIALDPQPVHSISLNI
jgi:hypothetical protein